MEHGAPATAHTPWRHARLIDHQACHHLPNAWPANPRLAGVKLKRTVTQERLHLPNVVGSELSLAREGQIVGVAREDTVPGLGKRLKGHVVLVKYRVS
jgi:hypothetical protein